MNVESKINSLKKLRIQDPVQKIYENIYHIRTDAGVPDNDFIFYITNENGRLWYDLPQCEVEGKQSFYSKEVVYILLFSFIKDKRLLKLIVENSNDFDDKIVKIFLQHKSLFDSRKRILDLGGHQGFYSLVFSKYFERVVCVEPFPQNYLTIELNLIANSVQNVKVLPNFISGTKKQGILSQSEQKHIISNLYDYEFIVGESLCLDDFIDFAPDVVKIDIEGEEINAIESSEKLIDQHPCFFIEFHSELDTLKKLNYNAIKKIIDLNSYICIGQNYRSDELFFVSGDENFNNLKYLFLINEHG